jgi:hypothetical protein
MTNPTIVVNLEISKFGGIRVPGGLSSANLWSDGVVIATSWTLDPASPVAGELFTFRGTITRSPSYEAKVRWTLRSVVDNTWIDDYPTRQRAVEAAQSRSQMSAIRATNAANARVCNGHRPGEVCK